jgi:hypothetical protein
MNRPITQAPPAIASSYMSVSGEMLPQALEFLHWCGGFLRSVQMEAVSYRVEFCHPEFEGRQTQILFSADKGHGKFKAEISDLGPAQAIEAASAVETTKIGSIHESAVGNADAPKE